jgi:hypothetical protein
MREIELETDHDMMLIIPLISTQRDERDITTDIEHDVRPRDIRDIHRCDHHILREETPENTLNIGYRAL